MRCRRQARAETPQRRPPERHRLPQVGENLSVFGLEREHRLEHQLHRLAVESGDEVDNPIWIDDALPVELRRERPVPVTKTVSLLQVHHLRIPSQSLQPRVRITVALRGACRARVAHIQTEGDRHRGRAVKRRHQLLGRIQLRWVFPRDRHDFPKQEVELARSRVLGQHANRRDDVGDGPLSFARIVELAHAQRADMTADPRAPSVAAASIAARYQSRARSRMMVSGCPSEFWL